MYHTMITLLINVLIIVLVVWIIKLVLDWLALPAPINKIVYVIAALIIILWLLRTLGLY